MTRRFRSKEGEMETILELLKIIVYVGCFCVVVSALAVIYTIYKIGR